MLQFPEDYFKEEIRDGFAVSGIMKRVFAAQQKILDELKVIFQKYNLIYYADFGTLLGAIRHRGFIPWDDDIDISMPRTHMMEFLKHIDELPDSLNVLSIYTSDTYHQFHLNVTNSRSERFEWDENRMREYYGSPYIIGIDIFPMDYIYRDEEKNMTQRRLYTFAYSLVQTCVKLENSFINNEAVDETEAEKFYSNVEILKGYMKSFLGGDARIDEDRPLRNELCLAADRFAMMCPEKEADMVDYAPHRAYTERDNTSNRRKEWVERTINVPFEVTEIAVPVEYDSVLRVRFGADYNTPVKFASVHEYPFYKSQARVMGETADYLDICGKQGVDPAKGERAEIQIFGKDTGEDERKRMKESYIESLTKEWRKLIAGKKILLYHTSAVSVLVHPTDFLGKLKRNLDILREAEGVVLWWFPTDFEKEEFWQINSQVPELTGGYRRLIEEYKAGGFGIYDETGNISRALALADAYYGDEGLIKSLYEASGRPIMIQNYEI